MVATLGTPAIHPEAPNPATNLNDKTRSTNLELRFALTWNPKKGSLDCLVPGEIILIYGDQSIDRMVKAGGGRTPDLVFQVSGFSFQVSGFGFQVSGERTPCTCLSPNRTCGTSGRATSRCSTCQNISRLPTSSRIPKASLARLFNLQSSTRTVEESLQSAVEEW